MAHEKKERKLTEAEQRRLDHFNEVGDALVAQGYTRTDLRINMVTANVVSIVGAVALLALCIVAFSFIHPEVDLASGYSLIVLLVVFVVLIVVHELIHGFTWSRFTPNGFKDVEFGVMWSALAPYCACNAPLKKGPYILGALMPLITLVCLIASQLRV